MTTPPTPDPWPALDELASLINDVATQVLTHTKQLDRLADKYGAQPGKMAASAADPADLRGWVEALVAEYGLHAQLGPPERWENIPPLRAELLGLMIADVRRVGLEQGSFEFVYWHDALARVVDRATQHADRWHQDQQNQSLLQAHSQV